MLLVIAERIVYTARKYLPGHGRHAIEDLIIRSPLLIRWALMKYYHHGYRQALEVLTPTTETVVQNPTKITFFDLPGEIRNRIYELSLYGLYSVLEIQRCDRRYGAEHVPRSKLEYCDLKLYTHGHGIPRGKAGKAPFFGLEQVMVNRQFYFEYGNVIKAKIPLRHSIMKDPFYDTELRRIETSMFMSRRADMERLRQLDLGIYNRDGLAAFCEVVLPNLINLRRFNIHVNGVLRREQNYHWLEIRQYGDVVDNGPVRDLEGFSMALRTDRLPPELLVYSKALLDSLLRQIFHKPVPELQIFFRVTLGWISLSHQDQAGNNHRKWADLAEITYGPAKASELSEGRLTVSESVREMQDIVMRDRVWFLQADPWSMSLIQA